MKFNPNVVAIVQARMGSARLPGKVLLYIEDKPMLYHVVYRLKHSKLINRIVIATSTNNKDNAIEKFCKEHVLDFYRGDEKDVLDRYYYASMIFDADIVVRVTADCPLVDPNIVDLVIRVHMCGGFDLTTNIIKRTFPRGLDTEVFNLSALEVVYKKAYKSYHREHVTSYFYENPKIFNLYNVENNSDLSYLRWTVDEKRDLLFVREIYKRLYKKNDIFLTQEIIRLLEREPYLLEINKNVKQKSI